jgi:hypothetical protein
MGFLLARGQESEYKPNKRPFLGYHTLNNRSITPASHLEVALRGNYLV